MRCSTRGHEHNQRIRYKSGFFCEDCWTWFSRDSDTFRRCELPSRLWCVVHNIGARASRAGEDMPDVKEICDGLNQENEIARESWIVRAEHFIRLHGQDEHSASIELRV